MKRYRGLLAALVVLVALVVAPSAQAAFPSVFGGGAPCATLSSNGNIRLCTGYTQTWDGTKINVNVFLPPETGGADGPYPMIGDFHGWGSSKQGLNEVPPASGTPPLGGYIEGKDPRIQHWAEEGYAVFSMTDRGWGLSCGKPDPQYKQEKIEEEEGKEKTGICKDGYNHLMDDRYEVRDAQFLMSVLADEGVAEPNKIGATGVSYGGGMSTALAALRNRTMLPNGQLVPWTSPKGTPMELAAAVPQWPWTDLAYALAPNGRNLDYVTDSPYKGPSGNFPVGVWKASWSEGLNTVGKALSNYSEKNPEANIPGWLLRLKGGEPYTDAGVLGIVTQLSTFHSSFGIDHTVEPSPLLIQSGWNDDLFPVDEALRLYQRTRAQYPGDPMSLYFADYGHARSQNKPADVAAFNARLEAWFAHYLKGEGASPSSGVEAVTTTCPKSTPSEGPYRASDWSGLAPGEIRLQSSVPQTFERNGPFEKEPKPTTASGAFDPIFGPGACVAIPETASEERNAAGKPVNADYRLAPAPAGGYTLMGSPTVIASVDAPSPNAEIAARLVDVSPEGTESLVARTLYRPSGGENEIVFQLHPQGYHFVAGHVAKLELLASDYPYGRFSNLQTPITVSSLELRLPVTETPGSLNGLVQKPSPKVVPPGYTLAAEYEEKSTGGGGGGTPPPSPKPPVVVKIGTGGLNGKLTSNRKALVVPMRCAGEGACSGRIWVKVKRPNGKGLMLLAKGAYSIDEGPRAKAAIPLSKGGRKVVARGLEIRGRRSKTIAGVFHLNDSGRTTGLTLKRPVHLRGGK